MGYMIITLLLFQTVFLNKELHCMAYDRNVEKELMRGMASLGQIFKEFNDTLNEYQSQPHGNNTKSHVVDSSCISNESFHFFQNFNERINQDIIIPQVKIKIEKTVNYIAVCLQDKIKSSDSKDLREMCLQKSLLQNVLKNSKASKILGHVNSKKGDRINCSLTTREIQKETHTKDTKEKGTESLKENKMTHSKSLSGTLIRSSMEEHNAFPNGGWFACGVALGLFMSSAVFVFVWFRKSRAQRKMDNIRRETLPDRKAKVSSCYMDIDQYELIPMYKDPALNDRFTKPAFAEDVPEKVETKADPETAGGLDLHRVTDTTGNEQPGEHYLSTSECTSEYHLLEKQNSTSEETAGPEEDQPYFLLEENDTNSASRDVTNALDNETKVLHTEK